MTSFSWGMAFGIAVTEGFRFLYRLRTSDRTRDLDERLADYERERGRRWTDENGVVWGDVPKGDTEQDIAERIYGDGRGHD